MYHTVETTGRCGICKWPVCVSVEMQFQRAVFAQRHVWWKGSTHKVALYKLPPFWALDFSLGRPWKGRGMERPPEMGEVTIQTVLCNGLMRLHYLLYTYWFNNHQENCAALKDKTAWAKRVLSVNRCYQRLDGQQLVVGDSVLRNVFYKSQSGVGFKCFSFLSIPNSHPSIIASFTSLETWKSPVMECLGVNRSFRVVRNCQDSFRVCWSFNFLTKLAWTRSSWIISSRNMSSRSMNVK